MKSNNRPPVSSVERPPANVKRPSTNGIRVLVVDDEKSIRSTLRSFLQDEGYEVELAENTEQAQAHLANGVWDVVVTDIVLPGPSGVDLLKIIRTVAPEVQVVMLTGEPTVETAAEAVRAGACDYLTKPISKHAILRAVAMAAQIRQIENEKRRLDECMRRREQNLEKLVAERTQALKDANQRLESALLEIQRSQNEIIKQERLSALGQMVSGIAHDFNNALMPIVGLSGLLLANPDALDNPTQLRADIEAIHISATHAADVVRRLREFYRPEDALDFTPVDLRKLMDCVLLLTEPAWKVQAQAENRPFRIVNDIGDLPPIPANEPALREALVNLVLNAVDAMPQGGTIRLSGKCDAECLILRVSDSGAGMSEDVRKRCFEPFFTTKGQSGSGLGLAMVHGIVTRHGGKITVESEIDKGTTFVIRLPLALRQAARPARDAAAPVGRPAPALKVLVVDDEEWARVLAQRFLTLKGHTVFTASSGQEALDIFRREPVDLVITDRAMPGLNGDRIATEIKRLSPATPVLMLTGFGDIMDARQKPVGVDKVLGKPVTPDQLQEAVLGTMRTPA